MSIYRDFELLRTPELRLIRHGIFWPVYELTDGEFYYGKISYTGKFLVSFLLETAKDHWNLKRSGILNRTLHIYNSHNENIGSLTPRGWTSDVNLLMNNGFEAKFAKKSFFSMEFVWTNSNFGDLISIKESWWSYKIPYTITLDTNLLKNVPTIPLLVLLGTNFMILHRRHAAVH
jgi:hypothetical protein